MKRLLRITALLLAFLFLPNFLFGCVKQQGTPGPESKPPMSTEAPQTNAPVIDPIVLRYVAVRDFTGKTLEEADAAMKAAVLDYSVEYVYDESEAGTVLRTNYDEFKDNGKILFPLEESLTLWVSKGPKPKNNVCYFTFDDGPRRGGTEEVLAILEKYGIKATFFMIGEFMEYYPEEVRLVEASGNVIGCHTQSHDMKAIYKSADLTVADILAWENTYKTITGHDYESKIFRFPGGSTTPRNYYDTRAEITQAVHDLGYLCYDWCALNNDRALGGKPDDMPTIDYLKETFISTVNTVHTKKVRPMIILVHETSPETRSILEWMLDYLIELGYEFDTLDHFAYDNKGVMEYEFMYG